MNFDQARFNMIEQQIQTWQVLAPDMIERLFAVKRELFVPVAYRNLAFAETEIPLGQGAHMLLPGVEARMVNALQLKATDRVLEIGTGSGYMAALLAARALHVDSIEIVPELAVTARANLKAAGVSNVDVRIGDGLAPDAIDGTYDAIVLSGSLPLLPHHLTANLKVGGRMIAIIGNEVAMEVQLMNRASETSCTATPLFETVAPALKDAQRHSSFAL